MKGSIRNWLSKHPKTTAVLFTVSCLLTQAGVALAGNAHGGNGP